MKRAILALIFIFFLLPDCVVAQWNQDTSLYVIRRVQMDGIPEFGFVSLTDMINYSQHPDSTVLSAMYLGNINHSTENYHIVDRKHRERFLARIGISTSDSLFVYSLELDRIHRYSISDLNLVAFLDFYGAYTPFEQSDYMIGFALPSLDPWKDHFNNLYSTAFVYAGPENPFVEGAARHLEWKSVESNLVPITQPTGRAAEWIKQYNPEDAYIAVDSDFDFFVRNYGNGGDYPMARHVIAVESSSGEVAWDQVFFDSEGSYLHPLGGLDEHPTLEGGQWTGAILKDKPPIITGFLGYSFGCVTLDFVDRSKRGLWISCDNRH